MVARAFSSMPGLASGIAREIRDGEIKRYLIQPIDLISFLLLTRIAHKLAYYVIAILPFGLVFSSVEIISPKAGRLPKY